MVILKDLVLFRKVLFLDELWGIFPNLADKHTQQPTKAGFAPSHTYFVCCILRVLTYFAELISYLKMTQKAENVHVF